MIVPLKWFFILALAMLPTLLPAQQAFAHEPGEIEQDLQQVLKNQAELQKQVDAWSAEKQALLHEILDLKLKKQWLAYQNKQHEGYLDQQKKTIAGIQDRVQQAASLRLKLEPYLVKVVEGLERMVGDNPAFLPRERQERIAFLKQSLQEYGLDMSERLRRVLEALQVEAGYGRSVEVRERELILDGEKSLVKILRLGRAALYSVTLDGQQARIWNPKSRTWSLLPVEVGEAILKTMDMVEQKRAADLVSLPLRKPVAVDKEGSLDAQ